MPSTGRRSGPATHCRRIPLPRRPEGRSHLPCPRPGGAHCRAQDPSPAHLGGGHRRHHPRVRYREVRMARQAGIAPAILLHSRHPWWSDAGSGHHRAPSVISAILAHLDTRVSAHPAATSVDVHGDGHIRRLSPDTRRIPLSISGLAGDLGLWTIQRSVGRRSRPAALVGAVGHDAADRPRSRWRRPAPLLHVGLQSAASSPPLSGFFTVGSARGAAPSRKSLDLSWLRRMARILL